MRDIFIVQDSRIPGDNVVYVSTMPVDAKLYCKEHGGREDWNWYPYILTQKTLNHNA